MQEVPKLTVFGGVDDAIRADAQALSGELFNLRARLFPPSAMKELRRFTSGEAATFIRITDAHLRQLSLAGEGPIPLQASGGRKSYTLSQINELRHFLSLKG